MQLLPNSAIEEGVVYRLAVLQQNNAQILPAGLRNPAPTSDSSIALSDFHDRSLNYTFDPFQADIFAV